MLLIAMQPFDIYLLDVELPDTNGFELIETILQKHPEARILINTMHEEIWILKRLTKASISGAILKSADINELTLASQTILKGGQDLCKRFKSILNRMQTEEQIKELAEKCNAAVRGNLGKVKHLDVEDMIAIYTAAK